MLDAAKQRVLDRGFDQTSVEEITGAAEIANGTFFNYFDAKEDVLYAIQAQRATPLETLCASRVNLPPARSLGSSGCCS